MYTEMERKNWNSAGRVPANDRRLNAFDRQHLSDDRSQSAAMRELGATLAVILAIVVAITVLVSVFFPS